MAYKLSGCYSNVHCLPLLLCLYFSFFSNSFLSAKYLLSICYVWDPLLGLCCHCLVPKSCPTLCDPMVCSSPGSSVHGISQARILKWIAISFSRGSSQSGDRTQVGSLPTEPQELSPKSYLHLDTYLSGHHLYTKKTSFLSFVSHLMAISSPKKKQQNTFKDFM